MLFFEACTFSLGVFISKNHPEGQVMEFFYLLVIESHGMSSASKGMNALIQYNTMQKLPELGGTLKQKPLAMTSLDFHVINRTTNAPGHYGG